MVHKTLNRKLVSVLLTLVMIFSLFAGMTVTASATNGTWSGTGTAADATGASVVNAADFTGLQNAVTNATGDITIDLTSDVSISSAWTVNSTHKVTITSSSGKTLSIDTGGMAVTIPDASHLALKKLNVQATESGISFSVRSGGILDIEDSTIESTAAQYLVGLQGGALNLYSGALKNTSVVEGTVVVGGSFKILPIGDITVIGKIMSPSSEFTIEPQNGYSISKATVNGNTIDVNDKYTASAGTYSGLTITVADGASTGGNTQPTPAYTIAPVVSDEAKSVNAGDTFTVDAVVTADQADASLAAVSAVLDYDKDLVCVLSAEPGDLERTDSSYPVAVDDGGNIIVYGQSGSVGENGIVVAKYTFEALKAGDAKFAIRDGAKISQKNGDPVDIAATSGEPVTVTIEEPTGTVALIANADFKGTSKDDQLLQYTVKNLPAEGNAYFYGDTTLLYVGTAEDGQYVFEGFISSALSSVKASAIEEKAGTYDTVVHDGDVNRNDTVNAIDCLIAYDLANGNETYLADTSYSLLSVRSRLEADANNDCVVDALDARAIMNKALAA